eukprot:gene4267-4559_t
MLLCLFEACVPLRSHILAPWPRSQVPSGTFSPSQAIDALGLYDDGSETASSGRPTPQHLQRRDTIARLENELERQERILEETGRTVSKLKAFSMVADQLQAKISQVDRDEGSETEAVHCDVCLDVIEDLSQGILVGELSLHPECFRCDICSKRIQDDDFLYKAKKKNFFHADDELITKTSARRHRCCACIPFLACLHTVAVHQHVSTGNHLSTEASGQPVIPSPGVLFGPNLVGPAAIVPVSLSNFAALDQRPRKGTELQAT